MGKVAFACLCNYNPLLGIFVLNFGMVGNENYSNFNMSCEKHEIFNNLRKVLEVDQRAAQ